MSLAHLRHILAVPQCSHEAVHYISNSCHTTASLRGGRGEAVACTNIQHHSTVLRATSCRSTMQLPVSTCCMGVEHGFGQWLRPLQAAAEHTPCPSLCNGDTLQLGPANLHRAVSWPPVALAGCQLVQESAQALCQSHPLPSGNHPDLQQLHHTSHAPGSEGATMWKRPSAFSSGISL